MEAKPKYFHGDLGMSIRLSVLETALVIENLTSYFISGLVGIEDFRDTKTLGNQGSALSFKQKIDFLIDLEALKNEERKKMQLFMEIRNQFMHNKLAKTYTACYGSIEGAEKNALKMFPQDKNETKEKQLEEATRLLCENVEMLVRNIIEKVTEKRTSDKMGKFFEALHNELTQEINKLPDSLVDLFDKKLGEGRTANSDLIREIGNSLRNNLKEHYGKALVKIVPELKTKVKQVK